VLSYLLDIFYCIDESKGDDDDDGADFLEFDEERRLI